MNNHNLWSSLLILCATTFLATAPIPQALAQTTNINVLNNTEQPLMISAGDTTYTIEPYARQQLWQVERDSGFQQGQVTNFDLDWPSIGLHYQLQRTGKWFGSSTSNKLQLREEAAQAIFAEDNFAAIALADISNEQMLYGAKTASIYKIYHDVNLGIDAPHARYHRQDDARHLTVLTLNTQLMPIYTGTFNHLNHPEHRAVVLPELMRDYDVVILQELYDRDYRATLTKLMQDDYPYHTKVIGNGTANLLTGGLMIFSHWPIAELQNVKYTSCTGIDCFADKGGQLASINKNGREYYFLATHLQSEANELAIKARQEQVAQLRQMLDTAGVPPDAPVIMAGDLNIDAYTDEYNDLKQKFPHLVYQPTGPKYTYDTVLNSMVVEPHRQLLDYLLVLDGWQQPVQQQTHVRVMRKLADPKMWPNVDLSDHFGVEGDFVF